MDTQIVQHEVGGFSTGVGVGKLLSRTKKRGRAVSQKIEKIKILEAVCNLPEK